MASTDENSKQRIIRHMNNDHRDSVQRYVEYYSKVSRWTSSSAVLKDVHLDRLVVTAGGRDYVIPIDPPMASFKDTRDRVVEMDKVAIAGLGRSDIPIKEYRRPRGFHAFHLGALLVIAALFSRKTNLEPGSYLHDWAPGFADYCARMRYIMGWALAAHVAEALYMTTIMTKHSVPLFSSLWFKWVLSNMIEGWPAYSRINTMVKEKRRENEKKSH